MFILGNSITLESSERSDTSNWVSRDLKATGFVLTAFEGYTIKQDKVSLLLDRARFSGTTKQYSSEELWSHVQNIYGSTYEMKLQFANKLGISWYFLCYQNAPDIEKAYLLRLNQTGCDLVQSFLSIADFGNWTRDYRDWLMLAPYQEQGLPEIDKILRRSRIPWPGNLDTLLYHNGVLKCLVEFQNTSSTSVERHCNNTWFLPQGNRKGDVQRWKALDVIRSHADLPLVIIVWSRRENILKFKSVDHIVYPATRVSETLGLHYRKKRLVNFEKLVQELQDLS